VADFYDEDEVRRVYYPEMEALVKAESGASRVVVFDHTLRTANDAAREARKIREVVSRVHNDYTEWSGPQRVRDLLPDEAEALLARRFAIVQVWRPIRHPVETFPLAICDARSMSPKDLIVSERRYPNRVGQTYAITYNPDHHWYWFPQMRRDEAIVFKVYDSLKDGRARWTAHTAFAAPTAPPPRRPRPSAPPQCAAAGAHRNPHARFFLRVATAMPGLLLSLAGRAAGSHRRRAPVPAILPQEDGGTSICKPFDRRACLPPPSSQPPGRMGRAAQPRRRRPSSSTRARSSIS